MTSRYLREDIYSSYEYAINESQTWNQNELKSVWKKKICHAVSFGKIRRAVLNYFFSKTQHRNRTLEQALHLLHNSDICVEAERDGVKERSFCCQVVEIVRYGVFEHSVVLGVIILLPLTFISFYILFIEMLYNHNE